jgi:hypothetical protein
MESIGARVVLKLVFAHGPLTRWTLTGQGIPISYNFRRSNSLSKGIINLKTGPI